jgi:hypothetical protein
LVAQRGPSVLAVIDEPDGGPLTLSTLDLATARCRWCRASLFAADPDLRRRPHDLGYLAMHPDGGYAVLGDRIGGVPPGYADRFGSRFRMAALDLNTSVVTPGRPPSWVTRW